MFLTSGCADLQIEHQQTDIQHQARFPSLGSQVSKSTF